MTTPTDYREFAFDCLRWAEQSGDAGHRNTLISTARVWLRTAIVVDEYVTLADDEPARLIKLRQALN
jgi:hypothetical protein